MSRIILFGVDDEHVDVLTRLRDVSEHADILVVHPDPEALVLRLARMADMPTATAEPEPHAGDILVLPTAGNGLGAIEKRWLGAGAAVRPLQWLAQGTLPEAAPGKRNLPVESERSRETQAVPPVQSEGREEVEPETDAEPEAPPEGASRHPGEPDRETPTTPQEEEMPRELEVPAHAWSSPEGTFAYLVQASGGPEAEAVLWWDGGDDHWVPWTWIGPEPGDALPPPERRIEFHSVWGRFALEAEGAWVGGLPRPALVRVAEDAAVRDLLIWEREKERMVAAVRDVTGTDRTLAQAALEPVLRSLGAVSAFVWQRRESAWALFAARGEGVRLEGTLILPDALFEGFAPREGGWHEWRPSADVRIVWQPEPGDRRWPLRLGRLERALHEGSA